jgi:prepilin-type N-terminal cleavage/methylation domain-containing protein
MKNRKMLKNEKGFTLIEIIAVIIIMGILAAVAVPKFFSMQAEAKKAALDSAFSEASARFNNAFAQYILKNQKAPADIAALSTADYLGLKAGDTTDGEDIGDFNVYWSKDASNNLVITVVKADTISGFAADATLTKVKTVGVVNWGS